MHGHFDDLTGERFGRLTVLSRFYRPGDKHVFWLCQCDCGTRRDIRQDALQNGRTQSCGCKHREAITTHGKYLSTEYKTWTGMLQRCYNQNHHAFASYGGRGISVCQEWHSFDAFYRDMGDKPPKHSLDRIDPNGNYEPTNCRWATDKEQMRNRTDNHLLTLNGQTLCIMEWAEKTGLRWTTIKERLNRGWSTERALLTSL